MKKLASSTDATIDGMGVPPSFGISTILRNVKAPRYRKAMRRTLSNVFTGLAKIAM
jgi:hypothetical protein